MKKVFAVSVIFLLFVFLSACSDDKVPIQVTIHPSAQPLLETMTVIAKTVEVLGGSATAYAATLTPSPPPTKIPDSVELKTLISNEIKDKLIVNLGAKITVEDVKFGPMGAQEFTELYIEMKCATDNNSICPSGQVIIAVLDACKAKKKKVIENVPASTKLLIITVYDPGHPTKSIAAIWTDVRAYLDDKLTGDALGRLISYTQY